MKLYEIDEQIMALINPETGELLDYEAFEQLRMERGRKIENMVLWYKDMMAEAAAVKAEADALTVRYRALSRRSEHIKDYIEEILRGEKFSTPRCSVTYRASTALEVEDAAQLIEWAQRTGHPDCLLQKPLEVSKKAVTDLLKSGVEVPHAQIVHRQNVRIQ